MSSEKMLIEDLSSGREEGYKLLYEKHYNFLCVLANTYVHDPYIAETIVNDVVYNIWERRDTLLEIQSLRSYLMQSVKNKSLNHLKHLQNQEKLKENYEQRQELCYTFYDQQSEYPLSGILKQELHEKVKESIEKLPDLTKEIFKLSRFSHLKYQEIANKKDVSVDSVKYHMKSALAHLRKALKDYL